MKTLEVGDTVYQYTRRGNGIWKYTIDRVTPKRAYSGEFFACARESDNDRFKIVGDKYADAHLFTPEIEKREADLEAKRKRIVDTRDLLNTFINSITYLSDDHVNRIHDALTKIKEERAKA